MSGSTLAPRIICYHKQATSARTRFLLYGESVLSGPPLTEAKVRAEAGAPRPQAVHHLHILDAYLGLAAGSLRAEPEYYAELDTAAGPVPVLLAEVATLDPPFAAAEVIGARFIALTEARNLHTFELELLRKAYECVLG